MHRRPTNILVILTLFTVLIVFPCSCRSGSTSNELDRIVSSSPQPVSSKTAEHKRQEPEVDEGYPRCLPKTITHYTLSSQKTTDFPDTLPIYVMEDLPLDEARISSITDRFGTKDRLPKLQDTHRFKTASDNGVKPDEIYMLELSELFYSFAYALKDWEKWSINTPVCPTAMTLNGLHLNLQKAGP